ncbi:DUF624 domain-containing protein [Roseburia hominis]
MTDHKDITKAKRGEHMYLFSLDGPLWRFFNLVYQLVVLHVLWIIYSLPLFTIGASTTALYYACMKMIRTKEGYVHRNFHHAFKENFKQATIIWLAVAAGVFLLITNLRFGIFLGNAIGKLILIGNSVILIPFFLICMYIFPVQAKFENRILDNVKNALILSFRHFPCSLLLVIIYGSLILITVSFPPFFALMLFCGTGIAAYLSSNVFIYIFRKYLPDELANDLEKSGESFD